MKQKLLILGGTAQQIKLVEAAKKMGVYTIVTDYLVNSPAKKVADEAWMLNIKDVDQIVERCKCLKQWDTRTVRFLCKGLKTMVNLGFLIQA